MCVWRIFISGCFQACLRSELFDIPEKRQYVIEIEDIWRLNEVKERESLLIELITHVIHGSSNEDRCPKPVTYLICDISKCKVLNMQNSAF